MLLHKKKFFGILILLCAIFFSQHPSKSFAETSFLGNAKTGLFQLDETKNPVWIFVPEQYTAEKPYPLIIAVPEIGQSPEAYLDSWKGFATSSSVIVAVPSLMIRDSDVPYQTDEWILKLKKEITDRYRIEKNRIYLVGYGSGAHYASYLAVKYPGEYSAVALLNGAWVGPYQSLMKFQKRPRKQIPFFVSLKEADANQFSKIEKTAYKLQKKGYEVYLEKLEAGEDFNSKVFRKRMLEWLDQKGESWQNIIRQSEKSLKERIHQTIEKNIEYQN